MHRELLYQRMVQLESLVFFRRCVVGAANLVAAPQENLGSDQLKQGAEVYQQIVDLLVPWWRADQPKIEGRDVPSLISRWEAKFGRLSDPETQKKLRYYEEFKSHPGVNPLARGMELIRRY